MRLNSSYLYEGLVAAAYLNLAVDRYGVSAWFVKIHAQMGFEPGSEQGGFL